ncbi:MAG: glycosyltransferase [Sulfurospirillaceae bacterium]|nr:glycosyltransferase [Sulfurospirillaceae bacterium]
MRVVQIVASEGLGGLEKHVQELCNKLVDTCEVHLIAQECDFSKYDKRIIFHPLDLSKSRRNPLILWRLIKCINAISPDIVHAQANKATQMLAYIRTFLKPTIKTIATLHNSKKNIKAYEVMDHVIGVSHRVLEAVKNSSQSVIYNGISDITYQKEYQTLIPFGIRPDDFVIIGVGRLVATKNFALLITAIKELNVKLLIVGSGAEEKMLKDLVNELSIHDKVIFTGARNDVLHLLAASKLCVISSHREGFSYVMAEALLAQTPVLSTDVADMSRILPLNYVVPINTITLLQEKIDYIQHHYESVRKEFEPSFLFAQEHFTINKMAEYTYTTYQKIVN